MVCNDRLKILLLAVLGALVLPASAPGAVFVVTKTADDNGLCDPVDCALREAVMASNMLSGMDTIQVPAGTFELSLTGSGESGGDLDLLDDVEIRGVPGHTRIVGAGSRVFLISGQLNVHQISARLVGLEIREGSADIGAGISASVADVELADCLLVENQATIDGGGVYIAIGSLSLIRSTVASNHAMRFGGGIRRNSALTPTSLIFLNSTIADNHADLDGGAIFSFGPGGEIRIEQTTVVGNTAGSSGALIFQDTSIGPRFLNSILEGDCFFVGSQFPMSLGGNVGSGADFCFLDQASDQDGVADLGLLPLGDYGGPTPTHALTPESPAVDSALLAECPTEDQRGEPRPVDGNFDGQTDCDAGAVELQTATSPVAVPALSLRGMVVFTLLLMLIAARRITGP